MDDSDINPFRYAGEYFDREAGNIYLRARYYSPGTGRFGSEDPIRDGMNWYVYGNNNPVSYIDPSGLDAIIVANKDAVNILGVTLGHMGIIVQDYAGAWHYFSMGDSYVQFERVNNSYLTDITTFSNQYYGGGTYTDSVYIKGDFTASLAYYKNYNDENGPLNEKYNALTNNCATAVLAGLKKGVLKDGTTVSEYVSGFALIGTPRNQMKTLQAAFYNTSFTYKASHKVIHDMLWEVQNSSEWKRSKTLEDRLKKLW